MRNKEETISYDRYDGAFFGTTEKEPEETAVSCEDQTIRLLPDSVYNIHVTYSERYGAQGDAYYYLYTAPPGT